MKTDKTKKLQEMQEDYDTLWELVRLKTLVYELTPRERASFLRWLKDYHLALKQRR